jgi:8-oxo-dGDP phosphatase
MYQWRLLGSAILAKDEWVTVRQKSYQTGGQDKQDIYTVVERSDFVLMVAIDTSRQVLLVRQYRPGTDRSYWALPGGYLNSSETPVEAAKRELLEETGFAAGRVSYLTELHPLPAYVASAGHVILCGELTRMHKTPQDPEIECAEFVPMETAVQRILSGEINEMQAVAAILFVRELWRRAG